MRHSHLKAITASLLIAGCAAINAQQTRTIVTYTTGTGSASETDRGQALDEATQNATNWANSSCIGMVTAVDTTFSNCSKLGSDDNATFLCNVNVKARCEIEYRGRVITLE